MSAIEGESYMHSNKRVHRTVDYMLCMICLFIVTVVLLVSLTSRISHRFTDLAVLSWSVPII